MPSIPTSFAVRPWSQMGSEVCQAPVKGLDSFFLRVIPRRYKEYEKGTRAGVKNEALKQGR